MRLQLFPLLWLAASASNEFVVPSKKVINNVNPFYDNGGCLRSALNGKGNHKLRVCNSNDGPEAAALGYCRESPFDYTEVRLAGQDWETNYMSVWLLQIVLSELLDVPTTVSVTERTCWS